MKDQNLRDISKEYFSHAKIESLVIEKGEILFDQGDEVSHIYFLKNGELSILQNHQTIWQAFHNEFIGISSYFSNDVNYSSTVKACKKSTVLRVSLDDFNTALERHPELNSLLMKLFNDRINLIFEKVKTHSTLTRKKRLIKVILDKLERTDHKKPYTFNYTSIEISEFIGVSHNFVKKILLQLQERKLIQFKKDFIEVLDIRGLEMASQ